jgi:putative toxin-antitoxin system antitoxin component (TIGR02293 family)
MMVRRKTWRVKCLGINDKNGGVVVSLPSDLISEIGVVIGDELIVSFTGDAIMLAPSRCSLAPRAVLAGAMCDEDLSHYQGRLETFLNIPPHASDDIVHQLIEVGFSVKQLAVFCHVHDISAKECEVIINPKVLAKKKVSKQRLSSDESDRLFRFVHIYALAEVIFGEMDKAKHWLSTPKVRFSDKCPYRLLSSTPGLQQVERMLIQIAEGMAF